MNKYKFFMRVFVYAFLTVIILSFFSWISALMYRNSEHTLKKQFIELEMNGAANIITSAVKFGKSIDNYYKIDDVLKPITTLSKNNWEAVILDSEFNIAEATYFNKGKETVYTNTNTNTNTYTEILMSGYFRNRMRLNPPQTGSSYEIGEYQVLVEPIINNGKADAYIAVIYNVNNLLNKTRNASGNSWFFTAVSAVVLTALMLLTARLPEAGFLKALPFVFIIGVLIIQTFILYNGYKKRYLSLLDENIRAISVYFSNMVSGQIIRGLPEHKVEALLPYLNEKISGTEAVDDIQLELKSGVTPDTDTISVPLENSGYSLIFKKNSGYISQRLQIFWLTFFVIFIICIMIYIELARLEDIVNLRFSNDFNHSIRGISLNIKLLSFISFIAIYISMPFSAVIVRRLGETVPGLSMAVTASLPMTLEMVVTTATIFFAGKAVYKKSLKRLAFFAYACLIAGNLLCAGASSIGTLIFFRMFCGFGYGLLKCYFTALASAAADKNELTRNISLLNAGLLGGITAGGALGAIIAEAMGYLYIFCFTAAIAFMAFLCVLYFIPWKLLEDMRNSERAEKESVSLRELIRKPGAAKIILLGCIPLNIGLMYIVSFVPVYIDQGGFNLMVMSYAYLINGFAGVYLGIMLVRLTRNFHNTYRASVSMAVAGGGVLLLVLPVNFVIVFISAALMGIFDGFGVPCVTACFTELQSVKKYDKTDILALWAVMGNMTQIICPVIYNLIIGQGGGKLGLVLIGSVFVIDGFLLSSGDFIRRRFTANPFHTNSD